MGDADSSKNTREFSITQRCTVFEKMIENYSRSRGDVDVFEELLTFKFADEVAPTEIAPWTWAQRDWWRKIVVGKSMHLLDRADTSGRKPCETSQPSAPTTDSMQKNYCCTLEELSVAENADMVELYLQDCWEPGLVPVPSCACIGFQFGYSIHIDVYPYIH